MAARTFGRLNRLTIFGSAMRHGQLKSGVEKAPALISKMNIASKLRRHGHQVKHWGMVYPKMRETTERTVGYYNQVLAKRVKRERDAGRRIINIGGDNSTSIGSINGVLHANPDAIVVWVDAHPDINTQESSPSGNMHGMPLAYLTGLENPSNISKSKYLAPKLDFNSLAYIGIRDIDPFERYIIDKKNILNYTADDVESAGMDLVVDDLVQTLDPKGERPIFLTFDIDAIDPTIAPGTGTPVENGLDIIDSLYLCNRLGSTGRLVGMDMVEVNPTLEDGNETAKVASELIEATFSKQQEFNEEDLLRRAEKLFDDAAYKLFKAVKNELF